MIALAAFGVLCCENADAVQLSPEAADREAKIKAAYLYQIINYVEWPASSFSSPADPFLLAVVGNSPITEYLKAIAKTKTVKGRKLQVINLSSTDAMPACHLVFIASSAEAQTATTVFQQFSAKPSLLVGEQTEVITQGGVVNLAVENNQVRLQMSLVAAKRQQLKISSKLSVVAKLVD